MSLSGLVPYQRPYYPTPSPCPACHAVTCCDTPACLPATCRSASKYAIEAITDVTRLELAPWRISVSLLQPGFIQVGRLA